MKLPWTKNKKPVKSPDGPIKSPKIVATCERGEFLNVDLYSLVTMLARQMGMRDPEITEGRFKLLVDGREVLCADSEPHAVIKY